MSDRHDRDPTTPVSTGSRERRRLRSAQDVREWRRRAIGYGLLGGAFVLMVNAIIGESGYLATVRARREHERLAADLTAAQARTEALREQIRRLEREPAALEEAAREQLHLIRSGERVVILRDRTPATRTPEGR
jgi:cell division protein FtsB